MNTSIPRFAALEAPAAGRAPAARAEDAQPGQGFAQGLCRPGIRWDLPAGVDRIPLKAVLLL